VLGSKLLKRAPDYGRLISITALYDTGTGESVGMIYLRDNPLLKEPLTTDHVKHRLLGHWGASPALSFVWAHLNRVIKRDDLDVIFMAGPRHGATGVLGSTYLEGTYSEIYPVTLGTP
jgi:xylulose-5-phosphate/fructose-6-phosphate phosphoketolase